jgi:hypothetical protein
MTVFQRRAEMPGSRSDQQSESRGVLIEIRQSQATPRPGRSACHRPRGEGNPTGPSEPSPPRETDHQNLLTQRGFRSAHVRWLSTRGREVGLDCQRAMPLGWRLVRLPQAHWGGAHYRPGPARLSPSRGRGETRWRAGRSGQRARRGWPGHGGRFGCGGRRVRCSPSCGHAGGRGIEPDKGSGCGRCRSCCARPAAGTVTPESGAAAPGGQVTLDRLAWQVA